MRDDDQEHPIGWYLRRADALLTDHMNDTLAAAGVTRAHWQVLNVVAGDGEATGDSIAETLRSFLDRSGADTLVDDLAGRGWLDRGAQRLCLTDRGSAALRDISASIEAFRQEATTGISAGDYATTIRVLGRLVRNLDEG